MSIDAGALAKSALHDGLAATKGHGKDLKIYLEARARLIADGIASLARDYAEGWIDDDDVRFAFGEIRASEKSALAAMQATGKAAAQDAVNAMLAVASAALNKAIGIAIL
jgi:hypothetical protein